MQRLRLDLLGMMDPTLLKAVAALVVLLGLLVWVLASRLRGAPRLLLFLGMMSLAATALTHVFEALRLFPAMGWGSPRTAGHYVDLASALLGVVLVGAGLGLILRARRSRILDG